MAILTRYLIREIVRYFGVILMAVIGIYVAVDFIEKIDDFIEAKVAMGYALVFFAYKVPFIVAQITPVAVLLSVLITLGLMSKHNELIALRSSGISPKALLSTTMIVGVVATFFLVLMSEVVVPATMGQANGIWLQKVKGRAVVTTRQNDIWLKVKRGIVHIKHFHPETQTALGLTLNQFDDRFRVTRRIDAQRATYENGQWRLDRLMEQVAEPQTDEFKVHVLDEKLESLGFEPNDLKQVADATDAMGIRQLYRYAAKVEAEGYDASGYRVDLHGKIAFPFVCIIMAMLGVGLAVRGKIDAGLPVCVTYGIGLAFLYWILFSFCMSLGYGHLLPPVVAAWVANVVFVCAAGVLLISAQ